MTAQDLKNSILQLAIQGKLVEQIAEEGTAKELVEQIKAEKEQQIKEKKIKKEKPLPEIIEGESPFEIPESWEWVRLGEIITINSGKGLVSKEMQDGEIPVFGGNGITGYHNEANVREATVVIGRVGFYCGSVHVTPEVAWVTDNAFITTYPRKQIDRSYLVYVLQHLNLGKSNNATAQPVVSGKKIYPILFPIPPFKEQKRIVDKIEELLPYIEQYDKAYSKLEVFNKKFPEDMQKSILQYAIQGKLVEQRPEEGTAEELYQQIQEEKERLIKEGKIKKEKPLSEITEEEIPFEIPESWKWVKLGDIFQVNPRNSIEDKIEVSFIPMTLLQEGYVSKFTFEIKKWGDVKKGFTHFKDDDIIFAKITPCFQNLKSAIMENLKNGYGAGTTELHVLRCYKMLSLEYFLWFVKSPYFMSFCEANMSGTAGQQRVGTDIVKNVLLPLLLPLLQHDTCLV